MDELINKGEPIIQPILDDLKKIHTRKPAQPIHTPPVPAEQDQDAGGGFNPDHTDPQT